MIAGIIYEKPIPRGWAFLRLRQLPGREVCGEDEAGAATESKPLHAVAFTACCERNFISVLKPGTVFAVGEL